MSDFLERLAARGLGLADVIRPRLLSIFEPPPSDGLSIFGEDIDPMIAEALSPQSPDEQKIKMVQSPSLRLKGGLANPASGLEGALAQRLDGPHDAGIVKPEERGRPKMAVEEIDSLAQQPEPKSLPQIATDGDETTYFPGPDGQELNTRTSRLQLSEPAPDAIDDPFEEQRQLKKAEALGFKTEAQVEAITQTISIASQKPDDSVLFQGRPPSSTNVTQAHKRGVDDREGSYHQSIGSAHPSKLFSEDINEDLKNTVRYQSNEMGQLATEESNAMPRSAAEVHSNRIQGAVSSKYLKDDPLNILASDGREANAIKAPTSFESSPLRRKHAEANEDLSKNIGLKDGSYQGLYPPGEDAPLLKPSAIPITKERMHEKNALSTALDAVASEKNHGLEPNSNESPYSERNSDSSRPINDNLAKYREEGHDHLSGLQERSLDESSASHLPWVVERENIPLVQQIPQVSSPERSFQRIDSHEKDLISTISAQISEENTKTNDSDLAVRNKESDNTVREGKSEPLQLKRLLDSGMPREHQSESVEESIAAVADRRRVSELSGEYLSNSRSGEILLEENHTSGDRIFDNSPISSQNKDVFQGDNSDMSVLGFPTHSDAQNTPKNQSFFIPKTPVKEELMDLLKKPIPHDALVQPFEISGENVEQIRAYRPEKSITMDVQQFSAPSERLLWGSLKQTGTDQENCSNDREKLSALIFQEAVDYPGKTLPLQAYDIDICQKQGAMSQGVGASGKEISTIDAEINRKIPVSRFDGVSLNAINRSAMAMDTPTQNDLTHSLEKGEKSEVRDEKIRLGERERVALNGTPEISDFPESGLENPILRPGRKIVSKRAKAGEFEVFDKRGYASLAGYESHPSDPGFLQPITGDVQPVAAIRRTSSDLPENLSSDPGTGYRLPEKDSKQMDSKPIPADKKLDNSMIRETTKSVEAAEKNPSSGALLVKKAPSSHPFVQLKGDTPSKSLFSPEENAPERFSPPIESLEKTSREFGKSPLDTSTEIGSGEYRDLKNIKTDADSPIEIPLPEFRVEAPVDVNLWQERDESPEVPHPSLASMDISNPMSYGNQDPLKRSLMSRRELAVPSEEKILASSRPMNQSETFGQSFISMAKLVPESVATMVARERVSKNSEIAPVQSKRIIEKALVLDRRLNHRKYPSGTIISPEPGVPETGFLNSPSIAPSTRSFTAQRSKMRLGQKGKEPRDMSLSTLPRHASGSVIPALSSSVQSPVIQRAAAAPEPANKVTVTVRRIEVRSGEADVPKEPMRAAPVLASALSLEEYLRLRGEGKL